ncbi:hypothetical protein ACJMK2_009609 [Sinanodonta woodiana]|uniref:Uncharacterized protein n=1 Tax=Sinanodonta woodiana TaxID=1069815 RepID=A0ABD3VCS5_SINWO
MALEFVESEKGKRMLVYEGWYSAFARSVKIAHLTLPRLIVKFQKEQNANQLVVERLLAGDDPPLRKKKYRDLDRRLC